MTNYYIIVYTFNTSMAEQTLTLKQRNFIKLYLEYGNAKKAALESYDCTEESAGQIGYENLKKLDYESFLEEAGITDKLLQEKIMEGLDSTRTISAVKGTSANGGTTDFIDVPDYSTRHKYLETALKLKKRLMDKADTQLNIKIDELVIVKDASEVKQMANESLGR